MCRTATHSRNFKNLFHSTYGRFPKALIAEEVYILKEGGYHVRI